MKTSLRLRCAVVAALSAVVLLADLSCDALNPTFVNQLGGNANAATPSPTGSIVVALNNQRGIPMILSYEIENTQPNGVLKTSTFNLTSNGGLFMLTHDCNTSKITLTGLAGATVSGTASTQPATSQPAGAISGTFAPPKLQCGSVIFVNVPLIGLATVSIVP